MYSCNVICNWDSKNNNYYHLISFEFNERKLKQKTFSKKIFFILRNSRNTSKPNTKKVQNI